MNQNTQQNIASPSNSRIDINTESLKQNRRTYMALGDLYQIEIFTDKTYLITEELIHQKEFEENQLKSQVFVIPMAENIEVHPEDWLFTSLTSTQNKQDYFIEKKENNLLWIAGMVVLVTVFIIIMIQMQRRRRKRREEYVANINL